MEHTARENSAFLAGIPLGGSSAQDAVPSWPARGCRFLRSIPDSPARSELPRGIPVWIPCCASGTSPALAAAFSRAAPAGLCQRRLSLRRAWGQTPAMNERSATGPAPTVVAHCAARRESRARACPFATLLNYLSHIPARNDISIQFLRKYSWAGLFGC